MLIQTTQISCDLVVTMLTKGSTIQACEVIEGLAPDSELRTAQVVGGRLVLTFRRIVPGETRGIDRKEELTLRFKTLYQDKEGRT